MILYFSATGNCKYVATRIAEALHDECASIEQQSPHFHLNPGEALGIVTPTNWLELPVLVRDFLQKLTLEKSSGEHYSFLVATYGTSPGCCGEDARAILKKRDVKLDAAFSVRMPDTWTPIFDLSNPQEVARQNEAAEQELENVIKGILEKRSGNFTDHRYPFAIRLIADPFLNYERMTKHFYVESQCIGCGLCAKNCPVKAIEMKDNKPVWVKDRCAVCLRCLHHCPKFAIQYGNGKTKQHGQYRNPHTRV